jgi:hypothetical protein
MPKIHQISLKHQQKQKGPSVVNSFHTLHCIRIRAQVCENPRKRRKILYLMESPHFFVKNAKMFISLVSMNE